jgi:hypothetical protein
METFFSRCLRSLINAPRSAGGSTKAVVRHERSEYSFGERYWASLTRTRLPARAAQPEDAVRIEHSRDTATIDVITFPPPIFRQPGVPARKPSLRPQRKPERKRSGKFIVQVASVVAVVGAGVLVAAISIGARPLPSSQPANSTPSITELKDKLLTGAEMTRAARHAWQAIKSILPDSPCFPLPDKPSRSVTQFLEDWQGANLIEVIDYFSTSASASRVYKKFASTVNNCSWQIPAANAYISFNTVPHSIQELDSASSLWDVHGVAARNSDASTPSHAGAICAVRAGNLDAFVFIIATGTVAGSPSITKIRDYIEPAIARELS